MAKMVDDTVLDGAFNILNNAVRMTACSTQPANYAGIAAVALADVVIDSSDFTIANGDVSGRKATIAAQAGVTVDASGTFGHVALDDGATLLYVTTGTSQVLTAANTANFPAWKVEIADPT